jgi:hypothetical protein
MQLDLDGGSGSGEDLSRAAPGAETEGRADALNRSTRPSLRDRHLCDKPSRQEAATQAVWSRTVFPYALPSRFQFTLNQDTSVLDLHYRDAVANPIATAVRTL